MTILHERRTATKITQLVPFSFFNTIIRKMKLKNVKLFLTKIIYSNIMALILVMKLFYHTNHQP